MVNPAQCFNLLNQNGKSLRIAPLSAFDINQNYWLTSQRHIGRAALQKETLVELEKGEIQLNLKKNGTLSKVIELYIKSGYL